MLVNVNTTSAQELKQAFAIIGDIVTYLIFDFRQKYGVVEREAVSLALQGNLPTQILDLMDFSVPVPQANSWETLRTFSKTQRAPAVKESEVASTQSHFAWLSKAARELDKDLPGLLVAALQVQVAEELRSYKTDFESKNIRAVKVAHSSRSARRSKSNSPK